MKFDISIPNAREGMSAAVGSTRVAEIAEVAVLAEQLGFHGVWATDFLTPTATYKIPDAGTPNWFEPIVCLAYCAALTRRVRLGTAVIMAPFRDPVILAKEVATLDQLSGGRVSLGLGVGMARDEFVAIHPRRANIDRGRLLGEFIASFSALMRHGDQKVSFAGEYIEFDAVALDPKPVQSPLPIFIPGRVTSALERIARNNIGVMLRTNMLERQLAELRQVGDRLGIDTSKTEVIAEVELCIAATQEKAYENYAASRQGRLRIERQGRDLSEIFLNNFIGTPDQIFEKIDRFSKYAGHFAMLSIGGDSNQSRHDQLQHFSEAVISRFG
jgi:probable F420-dependent oxidoreductase